MESYTITKDQPWAADALGDVAARIEIANGKPTPESDNLRVVAKAWRAERAAEKPEPADTADEPAE